MRLQGTVYVSILEGWCFLLLTGWKEAQAGSGATTWSQDLPATAMGSIQGHVPLGPRKPLR